MGDPVLADPQGQKQLSVAGVCLYETFNNALDMETTSLWAEPRRLDEIESGVAPCPGWTASQELARIATVAEPGGQAPGVTVDSEALRLPQGILQRDNQDAGASGSSQEKILPEVSAGTSLMAERKAACMLRKVYADSKIESTPGDTQSPWESDAISVRLEELTSPRQSSSVMRHSRRADQSKPKGVFRDI